MAIILNILTPTAAPTTTSGNFFYDDYSIKYFITSNRLILIKTAKNIVTSMNNNAFAYALTSSIEPYSTEPSIVRHGNNSNKSSDNKANIENLTININFLNYYFNDG